MARRRTWLDYLFGPWLLRVLGVELPERPTVEMIGTGGVTISAVDDPATDATKVTIDGSGVTGTSTRLEMSAAPTGTINNLSGFDNATSVRFTGVSPTLNGIAGGAAGRELTVTAVGGPLVLAHEAGGSTAANRIATSSGDPVTIQVGGVARLVYDGGISRWRVVDSGVPNMHHNAYGFGFGTHVPNNPDDFFHVELNGNFNTSMLIKNTDAGALAQAVLHLFAEHADMRFACYSDAAGHQCNISVNNNIGFHILQLATARTTFWGPNDSGGVAGGCFPNAYFETDGSFVINNVDAPSGGVGKAGVTKLRVVNLKTHASAAALFNVVADVADFGVTVFADEAAGANSSAVQLRVGNGKIVNFIVASSAPLDHYTNNTFRERIGATGSKLITDNGTARNPNAAAILDLDSNSKALLLPRLTSAQRTALAVNGLEVYDTDEAQFFDYYANAWRRRGIPAYTWLLRPATATAGKVIEITDVGDGGSFWVGNGTDWIPMGPITLARSAVQSSMTGSTTETQLAAITIPAGLLGKNGSLRIRVYFTFTGSTNSKTFRVRYSTSSGTLYLNNATTTVGNISFMGETIITNRNDPALQVAFATALTGNDGFANNSVQTSAVNTAAATQVFIGGLLGLGTETINLEFYEVTLLP